MNLWQRFAYKISMEGPGRLNYREGNREYIFPAYENGGETVIGALPSSRRLFLFFRWVPQFKEFSESDKTRILPRLLEFFRRDGKCVRIFDRGDGDSEPFLFFPELFEERGKALELLGERGFTWFTDYNSVDLLHEEYGLEVCGIKEESNVRRIARTLQSGFPHWHHYGVCHKDFGREPGWKFAIHMFPKRCGGGRFQSAE